LEAVCEPDYSDAMTKEKAVNKRSFYMNKTKERKTSYLGVIFLFSLRPYACLSNLTFQVTKAISGALAVLPISKRHSLPLCLLLGITFLFSLVSCTPKKSAEQLAMEAMEANIRELQLALQALSADDTEDETVEAENEDAEKARSERRERREERRERRAALLAELEAAETKLETVAAAPPAKTATTTPPATTPPATSTTPPASTTATPPATAQTQTPATQQTATATSQTSQQYTPESHFEVSPSGNIGGVSIHQYSGPGGDVNIPPTIGGQSVQYIGGFAYNRTITSLTIPDSVLSLGVSINGMASLRTLVLGNGITEIPRNAFYGVIALTSVTMPTSVTTIGQSAFYHCTALRNITIPASVTTIDAFAFDDCSSLETVTILRPSTGTTFEGTIIGSNVFKGTSDNLVIRVPSGSAASYKNAGTDWSLVASRIQEGN
jgi:hypothetical protein